MNSRDFNLPLLIPNLGVLAFVAIGLLNDQAPLVSLRPGTVTPMPVRTAEAASRLWQDPLGVKMPPLPPPDDCATPTPPPLQTIFAAAAAEKKAARLERFGQQENPPPFRALLLPVLLSSQSQPETVETRLRTRYAVLSGLGRAQYLPTKPDRIQFASIGGGSLVARYEEFEVRYLVGDQVRMIGHENDWPPTAGARGATELRVNHPYDRVVVLWLDQEAVLAPPAGQTAGSPALHLVRNLETVVSALLGTTHLTSLTGTEIEVKIVGPTGSDQLLGLIDPAGAAPAAAAFPATLLSPRATAAPEVLQISTSRQPVFARVSVDRLAGITPAWMIERTIATDDQLVASVLQELARRDARPDAHHHLVLIGEWDTLYSRGLARSFAARLNVDLRLAPSVRHRAAWSHNPPFLHEFSYLRGLDGFIAGTPPATDASDAAPDDAEEEPNGEAKSATTDQKLEHASGPSQFDYLRRLVRTVKELEADLARTHGPDATIGAIGVVGSDTYDKLLVLRALRSSFPRAVFFTTDFDASYFDRSEGKWTNNLLVVAPYGLTVHPTLQSRIPPFRDSYQSALFLTILHAVGVDTVNGQPLHLAPQDPPPPPRIFELGRTGYVDLSCDPADSRHAPVHPARPTARTSWMTPTAGLVLGLLIAAALFCWCVRPAPPWDYFHVIFGLLWMIGAIGLVTRSTHNASTGQDLPAPLKLGLAVLLIWSLARTQFVLRQLRHRRLFRRGRWLPLVGTLIAFACFGGVLFAGWQTLLSALAAVGGNPDEEPFAWFEGVSIWPTEIVRMVALLVAIFGVVSAQRRLDSFKLGVTRQYRLRARKSSRPRWYDWGRRFWFREVEGGKEHALWRQYRAATRFSSRLVRIAVLMLIYIVIFGSLAALLGNPVVPARGEWSRALDQGVLLAAVFAYSFLLFFVLDAIVLATAFIQRLTGFIGRETELPDRQAIHLINDLTDEIAGLIYLPFSVLFMLIVSRNALFDAWDWPAVLLVVFGSGLALIVLVSFLLQSRARRAKAAAVDALDDEIVENLRLAQQPGGPGVLARARLPYLQEMRTQIDAFDGVVFRSWHENPIFRAILIPLGGIGSLQLLERFSTL